jgi:hypothetical protein
MAFLTHLGEFTALPAFGMEDPAFLEQPIGPDDIRQALLDSEPRAELLVQEDPDHFDALVDHLTVVVSGRQE